MARACYGPRPRRAHSRRTAAARKSWVAEADVDGGGHRCRSSSSPPSPSPTARAASPAGHRQRGRYDDSARRSRSSSTSIPWSRHRSSPLFREGDDLFGQLSGQRKLRLAAAGDGKYSYPAAAGRISLAVSDDRQPSELTLNQNGRDLRAARIAECRGRVSRPMHGLSNSYVGWYQLASNRVLTVTRDGDRMHVRRPGDRKSRSRPRASTPFPAAMMISLFSCATVRPR